MSDPTARQTRALRGASAATAAVVLAAVAHTIGGGTPPPLWLVGSVIALATPPTVLLMGRRPRPARTAAAALFAQALLHGAFALVGDATPLAAAHLHGLPVLGDADAVTHAPAPGMLLAHAFAAVCTSAFIVFGERVARTIAAGLRRCVAARIPSLPRANAAHVRLLADAPAALRSRLLRHTVSRRGPPALSF